MTNDRCTSAVKHLPSGGEQLPQLFLLPGEPERVDLLAEVVENFGIIGHRREFRMGVGIYDGHRVGICSTGIGGPSAEISVLELSLLGVRAVIRVGGMGATAPDLKAGDMLLVEEACGRTGAASHYQAASEAAIPDPELFDAILEAATNQGVQDLKIGVVRSTDSYYRGQMRTIEPLQSMALPSDKLDIEIEGACGFDMETETVLAVSAALGVRAASLLVVKLSRVSGERIAGRRREREVEQLKLACEALTRVGARESS